MSRAPVAGAAGDSTAALACGPLATGGHYDPDCYGAAACIQGNSTTLGSGCAAVPPPWHDLRPCCNHNQNLALTEMLPARRIEAGVLLVIGVTEHRLLHLRCTCAEKPVG